MIRSSSMISLSPPCSLICWYLSSAQMNFKRVSPFPAKHLMNRVRVMLILRFRNRYFYLLCTVLSSFLYNVFLSPCLQLLSTLSHELSSDIRRNNVGMSHSLVNLHGFPPKVTHTQAGVTLRWQLVWLSAQSEVVLTIIERNAYDGHVMFQTERREGTVCSPTKRGGKGERVPRKLKCIIRWMDVPMCRGMAIDNVTMCNKTAT